jgi:hypothetical protein
MMGNNHQHNMISGYMSDFSFWCIVSDDTTHTETPAQMYKTTRAMMSPVVIVFS